MAVSRPRDEDQQLLTLDQLRGFARLTRRLARPHGHSKKTPRRGRKPDTSGVHCLGCHGPYGSVFAPHRRGVDQTRNYIHTDASSSNPAKGNLHERRIWPKP
jgi:hypothetical protein